MAGLWKGDGQAGLCRQALNNIVARYVQKQAPQMLAQTSCMGGTKLSSAVATQNCESCVQSRASTHGLKGQWL